VTQAQRPPQLPAFLTSKEVAGILRIDEKTVRRRARDGQIPGASRFGRQWRFASGQILRAFLPVGKSS
jgi:excisionase family DNA binding protein